MLFRSEYFSNDSLSGAPAFTRTDANIDFNWDRKSPADNFPRTHFSARWTGTITVPASVGEVQLSTLEDDGVRVWIDGKRIIEAWGGHDSATTTATTTLSAGTPHDIRIEYQQLDYGARIKLLWTPIHSPGAIREAWIPPGDWIDAWNGHVVTGPSVVTNTVPLDQIPIWIKRGAVLPLAPEMDYTGQKPWDPITLDVYPNPLCVLNKTILYEDDTTSTAYQHGQFRTTEIDDYVTQGETKTIRVDIDAAKGDFAGASKERAWKLRLHAPANWPKDFGPVEVKVNGQTVTPDSLGIHQLQRADVMPFGDATGAPDEQVFELTLPSAPVAEKQTVEVTFQAWE